MLDLYIFKYGAAIFISIKGLGYPWNQKIMLYLMFIFW